MAKLWPRLRITVYCPVESLLINRGTTGLAMNNLPPIPCDQRDIDKQHIKLLAIFHFISGGMSLLKLGFVAVHFLIMSTVFLNPTFWQGHNSPGPPPQVFLVMLPILYTIFGVYFIASGVLDLTSGYYLWHRKQRTFSMGVAVFDCLSFPLGTVLGVFTLLVLMRNSVRELYDIS